MSPCAITPKERSLWLSIVQGKPTKQIAYEMKAPYSTVSFWRRRLGRKLEIVGGRNSAAAFVRAAAEAGLL